MKIADYTKLVTLILVCGGTIFLGTIGVLDAQAVVAILGASLGYVFGNMHGVIETNRSISKG